MNKLIINRILKLYANKEYDSVKKIIKENSSTLDSLTYRKRTSLIHEICFNGYDELLKIVMGYKVELDIENNLGYTPIVGAVLNKQEKILKTLISGGVNPSKKRNGLSLMHYGTISDDSKILYILKEKGIDINEKTEDFPFWTPLFYAVQEETVNAMTFLITNGCDVNYIDQAGFSALHLAAGTDNIDIVKLLVSNNANINCLTQIGTPLHNAAAWNRLETVKFLIENGAKTTIEDDEQKTPLNYAELYDHNEVIDFLKKL